LTAALAWRGEKRIRMRRRVAVSVAALCLGLFAVSTSQAATVPTWTNPCAGDINPAACERLTYIAEEASAIDANTTAPGTSSTSDSDTSTLTAWGIWFVGGILLVLLFAGKWDRVWRFWRD
jgi:hypothetical protein